MAYLPPPPASLPPARRRPRWAAPDLRGPVTAFADGQLAAGRQVRRLLVPGLTQLAEAGLGQRHGRQRITQTAVTVALAGLESGLLPAAPVSTTFRAIAHIVLATGHPLADIPLLAPWEQAMVRIFEVELADPERLAKAFSMSVGEVQRAREQVADVLGLSAPPTSECPGWQRVRQAMRLRPAMEVEHCATCGRCTVVAQLVHARRRRLWPNGDPVSGPFGAVFDAQG